MPKIIQDLKPTILKEARRVLLAGGYEALTMRAVAAGSGVAVGTVYNYFPSKELLCARVMLQDWQNALALMQQDLNDAKSALDGLRCVSIRVGAFCQLFSPAWREYAAAGHAVPLHSSYHETLVAQLSAIIAPLLARFGCDYAPALPDFLAESLLSSAIRGQSHFDALVPIYQRLL